MLMKRFVLILCVLVAATIAALLLGGEPLAVSARISRKLNLPARDTNKDVLSIEVPIDKLESVSANHRQGSIGFTFNNKHYFYYVRGVNLIPQL
jgi:hypothetical protein